MIWELEFAFKKGKIRQANVYIYKINKRSEGGHGANGRSGKHGNRGVCEDGQQV